MQLTSIIDLDSIFYDLEDFEPEKVNEICRLAEETGFLFPPIVVQETGMDEYKIKLGYNSFAAARKLHFRDPEKWCDRILCFVIEDDFYYRYLIRQADIFN